jgi:hypothetical protein
VLPVGECGYADHLAELDLSRSSECLVARAGSGLTDR